MPPPPPIDESAFSPANVTDDNYATRWVAGPKTLAGPHWLQMDIGTVQIASRASIRTEYPSKKYRFAYQASLDGAHWTTIVDYRTDGVSGSPIELPSVGRCRYLRLLFDEKTTGEEASLWEWTAD